MTRSTLNHFIVATSLLFVASFAATASAQYPGGFGPSRVTVPTLRPFPSVQPIQLGVYAVESCHGLSVAEVYCGSIGERVGLEPGDLIVAIDGQPVRTIHQMRVALSTPRPCYHLAIRDIRTGYVIEREIRR